VYEWDERSQFGFHIGRCGTADSISRFGDGIRVGDVSVCGDAAPQIITLLLSGGYMATRGYEGHNVPGAPFQIGERVRISTGQVYYLMVSRASENAIVRRVVRVRRSSTCGSGWSIAVDGGSPCQCCGLTPGRSFEADSGWFERAE